MLALFVKIVVFKTKPFKVDWSASARPLREQRERCDPQAFTPRRLTARPAESEQLEGKSTTPLYLVNSNKVCENSLNVLYEITKNNPKKIKPHYKKATNRYFERLVAFQFIY
jgi:hypothetical protein